jgi:cellulose synthase/poly-beta-1,6-N-acetylglucosamine synthase-like glycosyltransferase
MAASVSVTALPVSHEISHTASIGPPPEEQALRLLGPRQRALYLSLAVLVIVALVVDWHTSLIWLNGIVAAFYILVTLYKLVVILTSVRRASLVTVTPEEIAALDEATLPTYTILVPLFHEAAVVPKLVESLGALDYPKDKLEILLLLEEDDAETLAALQALKPGKPFRGLRVHNTYPRTKPKACNVGLSHATGEFLVIYDAEDRPEPDQLKKAAAGFRRFGPEVVCLQAKLNFYNQGRNLLSRWFTTEYSMWYDLYLPGLSHFHAPIPLGGTSNHFRRSALMHLGGWDPYNVAEDCDLGIRLYKRGLRTQILDSTTWEEACSHAGFWVRQRSRWIKGYMQTFFVHTRRPLLTLTALGPAGFLHFLVLTGGMFFSYLINPLYWLLTLAWIVFRTRVVGEYFPAPVFIMGFFCLFLGNFALVYGNMLGCCRRGYYSLVKYVLAIPPYWMMISVAAWKACWQLFFNPHYWEKTKHGLD